MSLVIGLTDARVLLAMMVVVVWVVEVAERKLPFYFFLIDSDLSIEFSEVTFEIALLL